MKKSTFFLSRIKVKKGLLFLVLPALLFFLFQCKKDIENELELPDYEATTMATYDSSYIKTAIPDTVVMSKVDTTSGEEKNQKYLCKTTHHSISQNPNDFAGNNALIDVLWPGLLVKGSSVFKGTPTVIALDKQRDNIRVTLAVVTGGSGTYYREIRPVLSEITNAMNDILNKYDASSPASYSYDSKLITSESHLKAALSLGWSNPSNKLNVNAGFAYDESKSTLLVTLTQSFFSFVVDPLSISNTFTDGKLPAEIEPYIKKENDGTPNPLAYISSVTYGRIYRLLYTTSNKSIDIKAAIDYAYKGAVNKVNVKVNAAFQKKMSEISVNVYQIGGDAKTGLATAFITDATDLTRVKDFIVNGAIFSPDNPGAPISYAVRSLKDNSLLTINNTFSYDTKEYIAYNDPQYTDSTKVIDIDGNVYPIVKIGNQTWMAENLRTKRLNNGDTLSHSEIASIFWGYTKMGYYGHLATNNGLLYNYYAVKSENLCPSGWHVPSPNEWKTLTTGLGGLSVAGTKLKAIGTSIWASPNTGTNSSGFNALPGGWVNKGGENATTTHAVWWSSHASWVCYVQNNLDKVIENGDYPLNTGISVRCLKDE